MFAGWIVVGVAFLIATFAFGIGFYGVGLYMVVLHDRLGWPVSLISMAITGYYVLSAAMITVVGDAFDRFGPRRVLLVAIGGLAGGVLLIASTARPWQLGLGLAVMAVGWAGMSGAGINAIVAPWFERKRGLAVSMAMNGATCGGVLIVPLWAALIPRFGLPGAALVVVGVMLVILVPLVGRFMHRGPEVLGLGPDGDSRPAAGAPAPTAPAGASGGVPREGAAPLRRAALVRTRRFWTISAAFALGLLAQVGFITHQVAYLSPRLGREGAALAVSLTTLAAIVGRLATGAFVDRIDRRRAASCNFALQALAVFAMIRWPSVPVLYLGCVIFGLGVGNMTTFPSLIVQVEYPKEHFRRVVSLVVAINQFTFA
ncbi:MAG TPA: MFS transporter, partial [Methylomirabilota bacterium]|nr:MFS transporter [Methylomirabilota bacterium]